MYINDVADICIHDETDIYLYADDAKIYKHVFSKADQDQLQMSLSKLHDWSNTWLLSLNAQKCKVVSYGRHAINGLIQWVAVCCCMEWYCRI